LASTASCRGDLHDGGSSSRVRSFNGDVEVSSRDRVANQSELSRSIGPASIVVGESLSEGKLSRNVQRLSGVDFNLDPVLLGGKVGNVDNRSSVGNVSNRSPGSNGWGSGGIEASKIASRSNSNLVNGAGSVANAHFEVADARPIAIVLSDGDIPPVANAHIFNRAVVSSSNEGDGVKVSVDDPVVVARDDVALRERIVIRWVNTARSTTASIDQQNRTKTVSISVRCSEVHLRDILRDPNFVALDIPESRLEVASGLKRRTHYFTIG